ncbi:MAG: hypothetical protein ACD_58C00030G0003 [uncultured bacterium]|nr:MAG: hypothetical protein ACD_58C00030G0003 [uncultured bacterium]OGJ37701.1 MAG: hypothetical protein A2383_02270 [Candidatus Pacebacteria bacterium RIFOXYB1_FULL_39_46]OGJ39109.1 MAG: hypothetical protein A2182_02180 [Candidatus Pacebacteria bacterium RIFOXYA1_FULL_38_18]OGJ40191.1 MAG: hypothetical protein A2582_03825 [Candidatus Pacebacteria bacterium RIFOXYD1_FULL_39_27]OGJ41074.1 MAG: hypothetical protein A2411_01170 [Candidatus Pacebacteria bacterium RIFOXYC1_FULL_39_21]
MPKIKFISVSKKIRIVLNVITFVIFAWLGIHLFALAGLFIAFGYPLIWLVSPSSVICFACQTCKQGEYCELCKKRVEKNQRPFPRNFRSVILNSIILLILALGSVGLIFLEIKALRSFGFPITPKTATILIPTEKQYLLGEIFPLNLEVAGIETPINAMQIDLAFDPQFLQVIEISKLNSFATIFIQEEINNTLGFVRLSGGLPNPGFEGPVGKFATVYFQTQKPGTVEVRFLSSSLILANDGRGTNVLKELNAIGYLILPEKIKNDDEISQFIPSTEKINTKETTNLKEESETGTGPKLDFSSKTKVLGEQTTEIEQNTVDNKIQNAGKTLVYFVGITDQFILEILNSVTRVFEPN